MCAETDEVLAGMLDWVTPVRTPRSITFVLLADALAQLPPAWRMGHAAGDDPSMIERQILVRADSAGLRIGWPRNASTGTSSSRSATDRRKRPRRRHLRADRMLAPRHRRRRHAA